MKSGRRESRKRRRCHSEAITPTTGYADISTLFDEYVQSAQPKEEPLLIQEPMPPIPVILEDSRTPTSPIPNQDLTQHSSVFPSPQRTNNTSTNEIQVNVWKKSLRNSLSACICLSKFI